MIEALLFLSIAEAVPAVASVPVTGVLAGVPETVWQAIIAGIVTIVLAWMQQRTKSSVDVATKVASSSANLALQHAQEVKQAFEENSIVRDRSLAEIKGATNTTLRLVNGRFLVQLRVTAQALRDNANNLQLLADHTKSVEHTSKAEEARKKAEAAEQAVREHELAQSLASGSYKKDENEV